MRAGRTAPERGQSSGGGTSMLLTLAVIAIGLWFATQTQQGAELLDDVIRIVKGLVWGVMDTVTNWRRLAGGG